MVENFIHWKGWGNPHRKSNERDNDDVAEVVSSLRSK